MGDRCAVQTLTTTDMTPAGNVTDMDGDRCLDVTVDDGEVYEGVIEFAEGFTVPCTDYDVDGTC